MLPPASFPPIRTGMEDFSHIAAKAARQFGAACTERTLQQTSRSIPSFALISGEQSISSTRTATHSGIDGAGARLTAAV